MFPHFKCLLIVSSLVPKVLSENNQNNQNNKITQAPVTKTSQWLTRFENFKTDLDQWDSPDKTDKNYKIKKCDSAKHQNQTNKSWSPDASTKKLAPCWVKPIQFTEKYHHAVPVLQDIALKCRATGFPPTKVNWYRLGPSKNLNENNLNVRKLFETPGIQAENYKAGETFIRTSRNNRNVDNHELDISKAYSKNDGWYACEVYNEDFGPDFNLYAFFRVIFVGKPPNKPHVTMDRIEQKMVAGQNVTFNCTSHDQSINTFIEWFKCGEGLDCGNAQTNWTAISQKNQFADQWDENKTWNQKNPRYKIWSDGKSSLLNITNVSPSDAGTYRCNGTNQFDSAVQIGHLAVLPEKLNILPLIIVLLLALIGIMTFVVCICNQKRKKNDSEETSEKRLLPVVCEENLPIVICEQEPIEPQQEELYKNFEAKLQQFDNQSDILSSISIPVDPRWEIPRNQVRVQEKLAEGFFGQVHKGNYNTKKCAVKSLKNNPSAKDFSDLFAEIQTLKQVCNPTHRNIINLIGVCTEQPGPVYVILEFAEHGNLRDFLRKYRKFHTDYPNNNDNLLPLTRYNLLDFGLQVCKGMTYLHEKNVVHRDLASRNVLVKFVDRNNVETSDPDGSFVIKIADFGLSRDVEEKDYYRRSEQVTALPWKWMSLEAHTHYIFTRENDVWGFGVVYWEIMTLGKSPYEGVKCEHLVKHLKSGARLSEPEYACEKSYNIMQDCWYEEPSNRPTFSNLTKQFEQLLHEYQLLSEYQDNGEYLDLSKIATTNDDKKLNENDEFIQQSNNHSENQREYLQSGSRHIFPTQTNV